MHNLTDQQLYFFETFGFLTFPGLLRDEIAEITDEFEAVFADRGITHDPAKRTCFFPFIDQRERLAALLDHRSTITIAAGLLGDDFNYVGSDGNYYTGDTGWHSDGCHTAGKYIKIALYLDPAGHATGALRVIPGSHRLEATSWAARRAGHARDLWGIDGCDVPAMSLDSHPGDVVVFDHNLMHAAYGGSTKRRMFTLNLCRRAATTVEIADLRDYIGAHARFWIERLHSDVMRNTASPARMRHLQQVIEHEGHLPALAEKARREMPEPSRG
jgi:hypothetical protein